MEADRWGSQGPPRAVAKRRRRRRKKRRRRRKGGGGKEEDEDEFAESSWFYSWCNQWFCMRVCCPSLLFPMHHSHYYSSQLLLISSAYHQISLNFRSACCAVGSINIISYFYHYPPNFTCIALEISLFLFKNRKLCIN